MPHTPIIVKKNWAGNGGFRQFRWITSDLSYEGCYTKVLKNLSPPQLLDTLYEL